MMPPDHDHPVHLLRLLGHLYIQHGQAKRGVVLLLIAARLDPGNVGVWRGLAHAFLEDGTPDRAIAAIKRLRQMEKGDHPVLDLLMARALWLSGRPLEARQFLRDFLERRDEA
jgi:predicted Zn-dependent protease